MLPSLGRLSLTRTGGSLAPGQSPEDVTCVICFHSLAAPPPDGENVWPFDDDPEIWIVACNNQHAFHKGCLRAYARDSQDPSRCPECRVPMLPQVLTHVSRPSSGEHAAREAREAAERAVGQERDAEDASRREREDLEREQREFQEMDPEERREQRRTYYGDSDLESEEESDSDQEYQEDQVGMIARRSDLERDQDNWSARADLERFLEFADTINRDDQPDRSLQAYNNLAAAVLTCISRGDTAMFGTQTYRTNMVLGLTERYNEMLRTLIVSTSVPSAVKGQMLRLLAAYADDALVQYQLRVMNAQQPGQASWDAAGAFADAIRLYIAHVKQLHALSGVEQLDAATGHVDDEGRFERSNRGSRLIDAKRVLHHLKWNPIVRDEWLSTSNWRQSIDMDWELPDDFPWEGRSARELVDDLVGELGTLGTYNKVTEPLVYEQMKANLRELLAIFRVWHESYSGFDEYNVQNEDAVLPFLFREEIAQLWGLANHMTGVGLALVFEGDFDPDIELEKLKRYDTMMEMLTRLVWLGVTWWIERPYPENNDSATPDEMSHFFWAYVAPKYDDDDDTKVIFKYENLIDLETVVSRNNDMSKQWVRDRLSGPWFHNLGMDDAEREAERAERRAQRAERRAQRARDGGETPDARRQRRD